MPRKIVNWSGCDKKVLSRTESVAVVVLLPVLTVRDVVEIPAGRVDDLLSSLDHRLQVVALTLPHLNNRVRSDLTTRNNARLITRLIEKKRSFAARVWYDQTGVYHIMLHCGSI